jgi:hypothetical protein
MIPAHLGVAAPAEAHGTFTVGKNEHKRSNDYKATEHVAAMNNQWLGIIQTYSSLGEEGDGRVS